MENILLPSHTIKYQKPNNQLLSYVLWLTPVQALSTLEFHKAREEEADVKKERKQEEKEGKQQEKTQSEQQNSQYMIFQ
jgi:hypothetical protein